MPDMSSAAARFDLSALGHAQPDALSLSEAARKAARPGLSSGGRRYAGVDLFVEWSGDPGLLMRLLEGVAENRAFTLAAMTNRRAEAWPVGVGGGRSCWRCRFLAPPGLDARVQTPALVSALPRTVPCLHFELLETV